MIGEAFAGMSSKEIAVLKHNLARIRDNISAAAPAAKAVNQ